MLAYIFFGSDTDCDGTSFYACGVWADSLAGAREALLRDFGGMTAEGCWEVFPAIPQNVGTLSRRLGMDVGKFMFKTSTNGAEWQDGIGWTHGHKSAFRYANLGANWNPWVKDDTIGIPALDTRYDDEVPMW